MNEVEGKNRIAIRYNVEEARTEGVERCLSWKQVGNGCDGCCDSERMNEVNGMDGRRHGINDSGVRSMLPAALRTTLRVSISVPA